MTTDAIGHEQDYVDGLYDRVDELREEVDGQLAQAHSGHGGSQQDLVDRDARVALLAERRVALDRAEHGLCFGRLDRRDGSCTYIGRMGLRDEELTPLLIDWRAPVASDFYTATAVSGSDVLRRRHLRTEGRTVVGVNDELLDLDHADEASGSGGFVGEAALMEALTAHRTGRMGDIVTTLQGEQDRIIRSAPDGVLVVQGGPGTGKTAVALHRAAYLLYTYPRIAERGVLVIGPSATFLTYIGQVLPSLGETQVVLATPETLLPGVTVTRSEPPESARLKGDPVMAEVIGAAVREHQAVTDGVDVGYDGDVFHLPGELVTRARERALHGRKAHNVARLDFRREIFAHLTGLVVEHGRQLLEDVEHGFESELQRVDRSLAKTPDALPGRVEGTGTEVTGTAGEHEVDGVREELVRDPAVAAVVDDLWPSLTPEDLLADLFADPAALERAGAALDAEDRGLLRREPGGGWSVSDIPLLDEAAELLGVDDTAESARARARRQEEVRYAQRVLGSLGSTGVSAADLADRFAEQDARVLAERAAADRTWAYGHLVVDEAQELSPMQWRMLLRRVPSGSLTVVGDVNQTSSLEGITSWEVLTQAHPRRSWQIAELTVSYRTPQAVMDAAAPVLRALDPGASAPVSARPGGERPWRVDAAGDLVGMVAALVPPELEALTGGHLAVIAPPGRVPELAAALSAVGVDTSSGAEPDLEVRCVVLTPDQAKGLEFDGVLVADVDGILAARRGLNGLYVAMTRPTTRLGLVHDGPAPEVVAGLATRDG